MSHLVSEAEAALGVRSLNGTFFAVVPEYLARPYLPAGKCVLLDADGGTGKTSLALAFAASLSRGLHPTTFDELAGGSVRTLYLHKGEDSDEELETVFRSNGGVVGSIGYAGSGLRLDPRGCSTLAQAIRGGGYRLVVLDALMYFLEGTVRDANTAMDVNPAIQRLNAIARATNCTFLNVRHTRKGSLGAEASALGMGSVAFRNAHRGQLVARFHPDRENHRGVVVVTDEKGSLMVERGDPFMFRREGHQIHYVRGLPDPFAPPATTERRHQPQRTTCEEAIRNILAGGPVLSEELMTRLLGDDHKERTIKRARKELRVVAFRKSSDGPWFSRLPDSPLDPLLPIALNDIYDPYAETE